MEKYHLKNLQSSKNNINQEDKDLKKICVLSGKMSCKVNFKIMEANVKSNKNVL